MASTGSAGHGRRAFLRTAAVVPLAVAGGRVAGAADYRSPAEVFDAIERAQGEVAGRLRAIGRTLPAAGAFVASVLADQARLRAERDRLRRRLLLGPPAAVPAEAGVASLPGLRAAQEALVHAHAEGLPALGDAVAVDRLARHLVDFSRHLAVIDLWIEMEDEVG